MTPAMAEKIEEFAAQIENRPVRTRKQISAAFYTLDGQLRYVAATIRKAQDVYNSCGIDISTKVGVLSSLFNLGKVEERVITTFHRDRIPRWNNFGVFTEREAPTINSIVGADYRPVIRHTRMDNICARGAIQRFSELNTKNHCT